MSDTDTHTPPLRQPEYMLGLALSVFLTLTAIFFIAGLADAPVDFVDLEPGASFDSVRASVDGPLLGALVVSAVAVTLSTALQLVRSRWSVVPMLVHFVAAKTAWVMAAFLPGYDGGLIGAVLTVLQLIAIVLVYRAHDPGWFSATDE